MEHMVHQQQHLLGGTPAQKTSETNRNKTNPNERETHINTAAATPTVVIVLIPTQAAQGHAASLPKGEEN